MIIICLGYNGHGREAYAAEQAKKEGVPLIRFPENGLHPRDVMELVKSWVKKDLDLVVETHSEAVVSELGNQVDLKNIAPWCVHLRMVIEPGVVKEFEFDSDGAIEGGWPIGYFC
jgi:hypothetical protein